MSTLSTNIKDKNHPKPFKFNTLLTDNQKLFSKTVNKLVFKNILSLVIYSGEIMAEKEKEHWQIIQREFSEDLEKQNNMKNIPLILSKNTLYKRMDVFIDENTFVKSTNIYTILLRILYIEYYKSKFVNPSDEFHKILNYKPNLSNLETNITNSVADLSINDIYELLERCMKYYLKIYNDDTRIENKLGKFVLESL